MTGGRPKGLRERRWNWGELYSRLEALERTLLPPGDGLQDFARAVDSARRVESSAVVIYVRFSRYLVQAKRRLADARLLLKARKDEAKDSEFMAYEDRRRVLAGYEAEVEDAQEEVNEVKTYLDCVERVLSNTKHFREDLSKRLKALEIERGIAG